ncbi:MULTISPECIES: diacylglycerol kinase [Streptomyces]|uniref:diacylglycerol kinase n=1 Tax=Streptomyces TaxID=1883 RepID=UPI0022495DE1|nr:diacylglycerol kinase [Streptomyces sp. JHD 1]MCX2971744.1 diacylglycerol kinase [Streptomyces sp. JHD 1]
MSAPDLLVVVDPVARHVDAESVRIARDVLGAGPVSVKVCLPRGREEVARAVARRGRRRPVVVGDDRALLGVVEQLHRERAGTGCRDAAPALLGVVPVGPEWTVSLARGLGLPADAVAAARAVLAGAEEPLDLLVEDGGPVLLGGVRIPSVARPARGPARPPEGTAPGVLGSLGRCAARVWPGRRPAVPLPRLRVEADGVLLADPGRPVAEVSVSTGSGATGGGLAEVVVRPAPGSARGPGPGRGCGPAVPPGAEAALVRARARAVTVSGPEFDTRRWTVSPSALRLTLPPR